MGYKQLALIVCSISKSIFALIICSMLTSENLIWGKWIFPSQIIAIYIHLYNLVNVDKWKSYDRQSLSSPPPPPWSQDGSHCHPPETLGHNPCQLFHLVRILAIRSAPSPRLDLSETITKWRWLPEEGNSMIHARELLIEANNEEIHEMSVCSTVLRFQRCMIFRWTHQNNAPETLPESFAPWIRNVEHYHAMRKQ